MGRAENTLSTIGLYAVKYVSERKAQGRFRGTTPRTVASVLDRFCDQAGRTREPKSLTRRDFERWLERPRSLSTKRNEFSTVRAWVRWMVESGVIRRDPTLGVQPPRQPRSVPHRIEDEQVTTLLAFVPDARGEAMVLAMSESALRCCEVSSLQIGDVDFRNNTMLVTGKGEDRRTVPLGPATADAMRRYLALFPAGAGPMFRSYERPGKGLSPGYVLDRVRRWMTDAGLRPERVGSQRGQFPSAHWMRHGAAQAAVENGAHPRTIQTLLGHASLVTASRYTGLADVEDVREALKVRKYRRRVKRL